METKLQRENIIKEINDKFLSINTFNELLETKSYFLGKKGIITNLMDEMKKLTIEEKKEAGKTINELKNLVNTLFEEKQFKLTEEKNKPAKLDVTLDATSLNLGSVHPISKIADEITEILNKLGFKLVSGPEIELDKYNFEMLNLPPSHPARDAQDSFYITAKHLLRTQTSAVQARIMIENKAKDAIRIVSYGRVYRRDDDDATHSHQFHQLEGLLVDENISLGHLKYVLEIILKNIFGEDKKVRLRPSFFPFTEPSLEADVSCFKCNGAGCNLCKNSGWIEVFGAGIINPKVLEMCGYNTNKYNGFAFGIGIERIAMLKYGISDIRDFYTNDIKMFNNYKRIEGDTNVD